MAQAHSAAQASRTKQRRDYVVNAVVSGLLIVVPVYLAALLLLKAMQSLAALVQPIAQLVPKSIPAEHLLSLLVLLILCFLVGVVDRTLAGRAIRRQLEASLFQRIPGYALFQSLTQQLAGESQGNAWKPALVEIEDALVPAFVIEELEDGRFTLFVPSAPTPLAGAIYIIDRERVHLVDVPFTQAARVVSQWGFGAKALVAAMRAESTQK
jgi:uncharacterized membrane protein